MGGDTGSGEKTCGFCGETKPETEFARLKPNAQKHKCLTCKRAYDNAWYRAHRARRKEYRDRPDIKRLQKKYARTQKYGLTHEQEAKMVEQAAGRCGICLKIPTDHDLYIDHHHESGQVRGLLCRGCNSGLGFFKDSEEAMERAIRYLKFNRLLREEGC